MRFPFFGRNEDGPADEAKSYSVMPEGAWRSAMSAQDAQLAVSLESAVGLPAVLTVIRLISHAVGIVPLTVVRGGDGDVRERAMDTWQWQLLHRAPGLPPTIPFTFKADLAANFAGRGQAFVKKGKVTTPGPGRPRITDLEVMNAAKVVAGRAANGTVQFTDSTGATPVTRGTDEIIQMRSFSTGDGLNGVSPITAARVLISAGLRRGEFEDAHLANGIFPGMALKYPATITEENARKWMAYLREQNQGSGKAGKLVGIGGGAELEAMPISLADAQFAEMTKLTLAQAAGLWQVPLSLVMETKTPPTDDDWRHFMTFAVGPVLVAMCEAFSADRDMFSAAVREDDGLSVRADTDAALTFDPLKKAQVQRQQTQTGTRLVDELRAADGLGPLPAVPDDWTKEPGKVPQITPVGGAPNPTVPTNPVSEDPNAQT